MAVFVILPAAGIGTRMAASSGVVPKQFLSLAGVPVLVHALRAFLAVPRITAIFVAVREPEQERMRTLLAGHGLGHRIVVVTGGDARQHSVANALAALPSQSEDDIVLIHDAVRPLVDPATIERTIDAITQHGAAIVGMPAFAEAEADEFTGTDEASLLERAGIPVHVVPGSARNLKVTQPGDLEIAEFYLAG